MVRVIVCCSVEDTLALLVHEGTLQEARQWSSTWTLQSEAQFFVLDGNVFERLMGSDDRRADLKKNSRARALCMS